MLFAVALLVLFVASPAYAGILDQQNTTGGGTAQVNANFTWSQSFMSGKTGTLDQIDVEVTYNTALQNPSQPLSVCLYTATGSLAVTQLQCGSISAASIIATGGTMTWFSVAFNTPVVAGGSYAIVLQSATPGGLSGSGYFWNISPQGTNPYPSGDSRLNGATEGNFDDATFKTYVANVTAATFRTGSATRTGRDVVVRWQTASAPNLVGFNVYRDVNGKRVRVNKHLILARGHAYSFVDRKASHVRGLRYRIEAVELDGSRMWYGPLAVTRTT